MNASRTTCWRCAAQLCSAQARGRGSSSSSVVALFSALSHSGSAAGPISSSSSSSSPSIYDGVATNNTTETRGGRPQGQHARHPSHRTPGHHALRQARHARGSPRESAIELFHNAVNRPAEKPPLSSLAEHEIAARLGRLTDQPLAPLQKLGILERDILPSLPGRSYSLPQSIGAGFERFIGQTCDDMVRGGRVEGSLKLCELGARFGNFDLPWRNRLVLNVCHHLAGVRGGSTPRGDSKRRSHVAELINLWKHLSQMKRLSVRRGSGSSLQFTLPSSEEILRDIGPAYQANSTQGGSIQSASTLKALMSIFLQFAPEQAQAILTGLIASVAVFSDARISRPGAQNAAAPLLDRVAIVLQQAAAVDGSIFADAVRTDQRIRFPPPKLEDLEAYVTEQWPGVMAMLSQEDAPWREKMAASSTSSSSSPSSSSHTSSSARTETSPATSIDQVLPLLAKAFARTKRPTPFIFSLWDDVKAGAQASPAFVREMHNNPEFLDEWMLVLCAVKGGSRAQEVLDLMQGPVQLRPTLRTYTNMMHGWKICKETDKSEALWAKLVRSGMRLDAHAWTERISGLIESDPQAGVQALAEMQAAWKAAEARCEPHAAVRPTIEVVNAAFKGLVTVDRKAASDVIAWAGREQIRPNVRTYNILLHQSFRSDPPDDVPGILRAMERQGIQPDEATFTILLEEVLGGIGGEPAQTQVAAVRGAFEQMAAAGFRPNAMICAKMLYAVTDFASGGADEAVAAVLDHMRAADVPVSPEVVTILIERAVRRDPGPGSLPVVRALLEEHGFTRIGHGDQTLWERVMSAHAVAGDRDGALAIFDDLARLGRSVTSLPCLRNLLAALIAADRLDDGERVVRTVLRQALKNVEGPQDTRYWQHGFWFIARQRKLFRLEDVPPQVRVWMEQRGSARMLVDR